MALANFYQISGQPPEDALTAILRKSLSSGLTVAVRGVSEPRMQALDKRLWCRPGDSFLPHGMAGGEFDSEQPVLLTADSAYTGAADSLVSIDGAKVGVEELSKFKRVSLIFEKRNPDDLNSARSHWKKFSETGCPLYYWSDETGSWKLKASENAEEGAPAGDKEQA